MRHAHSPVPEADDFGSGDFHQPPSLRLSISDTQRKDPTDSLWLATSLNIGFATISFVTTKYILVDSYFHYPLHLLTVQLLAVLIISLISDSTASQAVLRKLSSFLSLFGPSRPGLESSASVYLAAVLLALSLPFFAQTILHFPNLCTICMLIVFSFAWEFACGQVLSRNPGRTEWKRFVIPLVLFLFGTILLLYDEYRLEPNGLLFGLPAWGFLGISKAIFEARSFSKSARQPHHNANNILRTTVLISVGISIAWLFLKESTSRALSNLHLVSPALFVLNIVSTVVSLFLLLQGVDENSTTDQSHRRPSNQKVQRGLCWAGACAVTSAFLTRPAISTYPQILAIWVSSIGFIVFQSHYARNMAHDRWSQRTLSPSQRHRRLGGSVSLAPLMNSPHSPGPDNHDSRTSGSAASDETRLVKVLKKLSPWKLIASVNDGTPRLEFVTILSILVWLLFAFIAMPSQTISGEQDSFFPKLDYAYSSLVDFDIVVSAYKEPAAFTKGIAAQLRTLPNISGLKTRIWVYTKDEDVNIDALKNEIGADHVIQRPNIGREGETYLFHIDKEWDNLARHTLFVQAHVHNSWEFFRRIRQYYEQATGMLSLGFVGNICDCSNCQDRWGFQDDTGTILPQIYRQTMNETCETPLLAYKGQFIVSAQRIRGTGRHVYQHLHDLIADPESEVHQPGYLKGQPDSMNSPRFGFTLERLWSILFQCSNDRLAQQCPSILSGVRRGGSSADCQCIDEVP